MHKLTKPSLISALEFETMLIISVGQKCKYMHVQKVLPVVSIILLESV